MTAAAPAAAAADPIAALGEQDAVGLLRARVRSWLDSVDEELRRPLASAFAGEPKYFRPLTVFACHRALHGSAPDEECVGLSFAVELMHNMSLVVDDVLDESDLRRGVPTIQAGYGRLPAIMASGYLVADAYDSVKGDPFAVSYLGELLRRLAAAECMQWRLRRRPLGLEDWRRIAGEDTGSMFEVCAVLGGRSEQLRLYGHLLGVLYHGCDDVGDQRGLAALGGGGEEDIRDGILTLPAALAIRDPRVRELFLRGDEDPERLLAVAQAQARQLDAAEKVLDDIARAARKEARLAAPHPEPLLGLVEEVRRLSRR